jgi:magnesium chelatase subunit I
VPSFMAEVIERIAFEAREDKRIDRRSGVSQRMPISVLENVVSNAERRSLQTREEQAVPRMSDVYSALPAITGKIELEYEGELVGGEKIARELIRRAADATLSSIGRDFSSDEIVIWFDEGGALQVSDDVSADTMVKAFETVPTLMNIVRALRLAEPGDQGTTAAACELVLEALVARRKISRNDAGQYGRVVPEKRRRPSEDF